MYTVVKCRLNLNSETVSVIWYFSLMHIGNISFEWNNSTFEITWSVQTIELSLRLRHADTRYVREEMYIWVRYPLVLYVQSLRSNKRLLTPIIIFGALGLCSQVAWQFLTESFVPDFISLSNIAYTCYVVLLISLGNKIDTGWGYSFPSHIFMESPWKNI